LFIDNKDRWEPGSHEIAPCVKVPGRRALSVGNGHGWKLPLQKPVSHVRILHQCLCRSEAISSQASRLACYHGVIPSQFPRLSSKQHDKRRNAVPFRPPPRRPRQVGPVRWAAYPRLRTTVRRAARACGIGEPRRLSLGNCWFSASSIRSTARISCSVWRMVRRTRLAALMSPVVMHWVSVFPYLARSLAKGPSQLVAYEHQHFAAPRGAAGARLVDPT